MKLVIFGLTLSSSWGNGHATIWRGLCRAMAARGHRVVFFERDVPYYASHRDFAPASWVDLRLYSEWDDAADAGEAELADADVGMVTSYCPDGVHATALVVGSRAARKVFYDLDTPVTLSNLKKKRPVAYLTRRGLRDFDLVLTYTGGSAIEELRTLLGARRVAPLYGCVDPGAHCPAPPDPRYAADLSYLGTYADDRQQSLAELFIEPAARLPERRFVLGGSLYPDGFPWKENIFYLRHVPPPDHPAFFSSSFFTLNVTRGAMAEMGYCPSSRLFEAAACGTPVISDSWEGLESFLEPGREIVLVRSSEEVVAALSMEQVARDRIAGAARERVLADHTAEHRIRELEEILSSGEGEA